MRAVYVPDEEHVADGRHDEEGEDECDCDKDIVDEVDCSRQLLRNQRSRLPESAQHHE